MEATVRNATDAEWDNLVDSVASARYFQTREWFDIWGEYAGFENDTRLICFSNGKKVLLPLAGLKLLKGLVTAHFLAPKGTGGFVTQDDLTAGERGELFRIFGNIPLFYAAVNPHDPLTNAFPRFNGEDFSQILDLSGGFRDIFSRWSKGHSSAAKQGMREGISVETASTAGDWKAYYEMYQDTLDRWGENTTNRYTWDLFRILHEKNSPKIKLWLARYQGQPVSGALCLYHNRSVAYWHSASSGLFFRKLNASHLLQYHIIKDACETGYLFYDFLPSGGLEGVVNFKKGFAPASIKMQTYLSPGMVLSRILREKFRNSAAYKAITKNTGF